MAPLKDLSASSRSFLLRLSSITSSQWRKPSFKPRTQTKITVYLVEIRKYYLREEGMSTREVESFCSRDKENIFKSKLVAR